MTKKEIIIKAWMDLNIETPFGICDKTGWVHGYFCNGIDDIINDYGDITDKIDYEIEYGGVGKFRPKSLQGIENNNGWIDGIPKEKGWYFIEYINKFIEPKEFLDNAEDFIWWNLNVIKHQKYFSLNNLCFSLFLLYLYFNLKTK